MFKHFILKYWITLLVFWLLIIWPIYYSGVLIFIISLFPGYYSFVFAGRSFSERNRYRWFYVLLNPVILLPFIGFGNGMFSYYQGNARLLFHYSDNREYYYAKPDNISFRFRCYYIDRDNITNSPVNLYYYFFNDISVKLCTKMLGYEKGTYAQYIPSQKEIVQALTTKKDSVAASRYEDKVVAFIYRNKLISIDGSKNQMQLEEPPIYCINRDAAGENVGDSLGGSMLKPYIFFSDKYYPLLIVSEPYTNSYFYNKNDFHFFIKLVDTEHQKIIAQFQLASLNYREK